MIWGESVRGTPHGIAAGGTKFGIEAETGGEFVRDAPTKIVACDAAKVGTPAFRRARIDLQTVAGVLIGIACQNVQRERVMTALGVDARRSNTRIKEGSVTENGQSANLLNQG